MLSRTDQLNRDITALHHKLSLLIATDKGISRQNIEELYFYLKEQVASGVDLGTIAEELHDHVFNLVSSSKAGEVINLLLDMTIFEDEQMLLKRKIFTCVNESIGGSQQDEAAAFQEIEMSLASESKALFNSDFAKTETKVVDEKAIDSELPQSSSKSSLDFVGLDSDAQSKPQFDITESSLDVRAVDSEAQSKPQFDNTESSLDLKAVDSNAQSKPQFVKAESSLDSKMELVVADSKENLNEDSLTAIATADTKCAGVESKGIGINTAKEVVSNLFKSEPLDSNSPIPPPVVSTATVAAPVAATTDPAIENAMNNLKDRHKTALTNLQKIVEGERIKKLKSLEDRLLLRKMQLAEHKASSVDSKDPDEEKRFAKTIQSEIDDIQSDIEDAKLSFERTKEGELKCDLWKIFNL